MASNLKLNYVELPAKNINATKQFFEVVFAWSFVDYGPDYTAFENAGIDGGFYRSEMTSRASTGAALLVLKTEDLEQTQAIVKLHGGIISTDIFSFPGGRRFHFIEPSGNEFAVWCVT